MEVRLIEHDSSDYRNMIDLRYRVLLQPIGVAMTFINEDFEKHDHLIGAYERETLCGCCILTVLNDGNMKLRQMAVDLPKQKKGTGKALLLFAETMCRNQGYSSLLLNARDVVIPFYEKCGYHIEGRGFTEVGVPHHTMIKHL
ncbi:MAG: GNAT family N-acetyltransferase [Chitinophagaceae bacterium]